MINKSSYSYAILLLFLVPAIIAVIKFESKPTSFQDLLLKEAYTVSFEFDASNLRKNAFVKAYIPENNLRQKVRHIAFGGDSLQFTTEKNDFGKKGRWETTDQTDVVFNYEFEVEGKSVKYKLPEAMPFETYFEDPVSSYLLHSDNIQSDDPLIDSLAQSLKGKDVNHTLKSNFDFVNNITNSNTGVLTDAITALRRNRASCNGKSRLFVALCRAQKIPARLVGGIILENARKRTSHLWTEVYYQDNWIPFDVQNNHFASLPANYLELYRGDNFLITHTKNIGFDYQFVIQKKYQTAGSVPVIGPQLWSLITTSGVSLNILRSILLLPLAALIIAIFRNVIGLKTFGILLPALIALALVNVDFTGGIIALVIVVICVSLLHFILDKWKLLHIPKVVIMLTFVILVLLGLSTVGLYLEWKIMGIAMFLPIVVTSITAERFAKILVEESFREAFKMLGTTLLIALLCCLIFRSSVLIGFFLTYPEFYFSLLGIMLLLGRWIGMRVTEFSRFAPIPA